jgi:hypothetical protein
MYSGRWTACLRVALIHTTNGEKTLKPQEWVSADDKRVSLGVTTPCKTLINPVN